MGSGDSKNSNKDAPLNNLKPGQPVSARELVDAISELAKTVSSLNRAVIQLQNSMRARAKSNFSEKEKEEEARPSKTIH